VLLFVSERSSCLPPVTCLGARPLVLAVGEPMPAPAPAVRLRFLPALPLTPVVLLAPETAVFRLTEKKLGVVVAMPLLLLDPTSARGRLLPCCFAFFLLLSVVACPFLTAAAVAVAPPPAASMAQLLLCKFPTPLVSAEATALRFFLGS
ncbi:unnamed protein product, partial [Ectocarpus sp. 12 AP-2014]